MEPTPIFSKSAFAHSAKPGQSSQCLCTLPCSELVDKGASPIQIAHLLAVLDNPYSEIPYALLRESFEARLLGSSRLTVQQTEVLTMAVAAVLNNHHCESTQEIPDEECETTETNSIAGVSKFSVLMRTDPIEILTLTKRTLNALLRAGVRTIREVMALDENDLKDIRNLGAKGIAEVQQFQDQYRPHDLEPNNGPDEIAQAPTLGVREAVLLVAQQQDHELLTTVSFEFRRRFEPWLEVLPSTLPEVDSAQMFHLDWVTASILQMTKLPEELWKHGTLIALVENLSSAVVKEPCILAVTERAMGFIERTETPPNIVGLALLILRRDSSASHLAESAFKEKYGNRADRILSIFERRLRGDTLQDIGDSLGITRERVRQVCAKQFPLIDEIAAGAARQLVSMNEASALELVAETFNDAGALYENEFQTLLMCIGPEHYHLAKTYRRLVIPEVVDESTRSKWSDEQLLDLLRRASTYYFPLLRANYSDLVEMGEIKGPTVPVIEKRFGSWANACTLAGIEFHGSSSREYTRTWNSDELLEFLIRYFEDDYFQGGWAGYDEWRLMQVDAVPSGALIRLEFGTWSRAKRKALEMVRMRRGKALRT